MWEIGVHDKFALFLFVAFIPEERVIVPSFLGGLRKSAQQFAEVSESTATYRFAIGIPELLLQL